MSRNEANQAIGHTPVSVVWEPVGPSFEMMGRSGGWIVDGMHPIGLSADQAVDFIQRFPDAFSR